MNGETISGLKSKEVSSLEPLRELVEKGTREIFDLLTRRVGNGCRLSREG